MELGVTLAADLVNPVVGDLALTDQGTEVVKTVLADEVAQRLAVRLQFFKGEWFLDLREGMPYFERVLVKGPIRELTYAVFRQAIQETEGVASVADLQLERGENRTLAVTFTAALSDGSVLRSGDYPAFVVG